MEYYSAIKRNEIMPFAATWMDPETVILSAINSEEDKYHSIAVNVKSKQGTNELISKTESELQMQETNLGHRG